MKSAGSKQVLPVMQIVHTMFAALSYILAFDFRSAKRLKVLCTFFGCVKIRGPLASASIPWMANFRVERLQILFKTCVLDSEIRPLDSGTLMSESMVFGSHWIVGRGC